jgi:hypothetical protein
MTIEDIKLECTCNMCPEQYDAFIDKKQVGYLRLRRGRFFVLCPNVKGEMIYEDFPRGYGAFEEDEREHFLKLAKEAILKEVNKGEE